MGLSVLTSSIHGYGMECHQSLDSLAANPAALDMSHLSDALFSLFRDIALH